jgi:fructokinase
MFVVCGESLMDVFAAAETPAGITLDARVGGSPFNVAVGLARLGQPVAFLSGVSTDFLGDRLLRALDAEGVDTTTVQRVPAPTTLGLVGLNASGVPSYAFYGEGTADRQLAPQALQALPPGLRALHVGSYATVVEPVAGTLRLLVEQQRARALVAYDPNIRLNVEPDIARWRDALGWHLTRCHVLKVSDEDLQLLSPGLSPEAFAAGALAQGVRLVVVTRGAEGAMAWTRAAAARAAPRAVDVIDTVGAGDTFQAAVLAWLAEHDRLEPEDVATLSADALGTLLRFAAAAAGITCSRRGADLPRRHELPPRGDAATPTGRMPAAPTPPPAPGNRG